jgi:hypothetical protein
MPYIKQIDRTKFSSQCKSIAEKATCAGDLNFSITAILHEYLKIKGINYDNINSVIGMLECCKLEMYRKIAADYENLKITQNGDVDILSQQDLMGKKY